MEVRPVDSSILNAIKSMLGVDAEYDPYDTELVNYINSAIGQLSQLGGCSPTFRITGTTETWADLLGDREDLFGLCQDYIHLLVKQVWDPTASSTIKDTMQEKLKELTYRIILQAEQVVSE